MRSGFLTVQSQHHNCWKAIRDGSVANILSFPSVPLSHTTQSPPHLSHLNSQHHCDADYAEHANNRILLNPYLSCEDWDISMQSHATVAPFHWCLLSHNVTVLKNGFPHLLLVEIWTALSLGLKQLMPVSINILGYFFRCTYVDMPTGHYVLEAEVPGHKSFTYSGLIDMSKQNLYPQVLLILPLECPRVLPELHGTFRRKPFWWVYWSIVWWSSLSVPTTTLRMLRVLSHAAACLWCMFKPLAYFPVVLTFQNGLV